MRELRINFGYILQSLWLHFLRGTKWVDYLKSIANVMQDTNDSFVSTSEAVREELLYSSQKIYLTKRLQDLYNSAIYLTRNLVSENLVLFQTSESEDNWIYQRSENIPTYAYQSSETFSEVNFTVHCPAAISAAESKIIRTIETYKQSGTTYEIVYE